MTGTIEWNGRKIPYRTGESLGSALARAGVRGLGRAGTGQLRAVFCGIGQCQNCMVRVDGRLVEACLTICHDGLAAIPDDGGHHG